MSYYKKGDLVAVRKTRPEYANLVGRTGVVEAIFTPNQSDILYGVKIDGLYNQKKQ